MKLSAKLINRTTLSSECVAQFPFKNYPHQTSNLLNECVRNFFFKIILTKPQTMFRKLFFKLIRNCLISRCAIYFSRLGYPPRVILTDLLRIVEKKFFRGSSASNVILPYCLRIVEMSYTRRD